MQNIEHHKPAWSITDYFCQECGRTRVAIEYAMRDCETDSEREVYQWRLDQVDAAWRAFTGGD